MIYAANMEGGSEPGVTTFAGNSASAGRGARKAHSPAPRRLFRMRECAVDQMQVRAAHAACEDVDQQLARARLRIGQLHMAPYPSGLVKTPWHACSCAFQPRAASWAAHAGSVPAHAPHLHDTVLDTNPLEATSQCGQARSLAAPCDHAFSVPLNYCFGAFAAFAAFSTAWSAASVTSDVAFVAVPKLLCATSTA